MLLDTDVTQSRSLTWLGFKARVRRSSRYFLWALLGLAALGAIFVIEQLATAPRILSVSPGDLVALNNGEVQVGAFLPRYKPGSAHVRMLVDGVPLAEDRLEKSRFNVRATAELADGPHALRVELESWNIFSRRKSRSALFFVDTQAPTVKIASPSPATGLPTPVVLLGLKLDEAAKVELSMDGSMVPVSNYGLTARAWIAPKEGSQHSFFLKVTDGAGNVTTKWWKAWADFSAPKLTLVGWPKDTLDKTKATLLVDTTDNLGSLSVTATVDGEPLTVERLTSSSTGAVASGNGSAASSQAASEAAAPQLVENESAPAGKTKAAPLVSSRYRLQTGEMSEGTHVVEVRVRDKGGHVVTEQRSLTVDSTETFGVREMTLGAKGRDVAQLQQLLTRKKVYQGAQTKQFDENTGAALVKYKKANGLPATPILDEKTLEMLVGRIVIDISERRLYLYNEGKLVKKYSCAVGQPRYPTPQGSYRIIVKEYNPTWNPPPSPWAAGLEPVPPGPGNPLGTRWMGLSAPAIGIHGTYSDWSIGTAASHGCIRMHIWDVEELFEMVYVGTIVDIVP